jgi:hypothetical protein
MLVVVRRSSLRISQCSNDTPAELWVVQNRFLARGSKSCVVC